MDRDVAERLVSVLEKILECLEKQTEKKPVKREKE